MPQDQQNNVLYSQYGVFWLYNWFQIENNNENSNMNIFFLMNGNIFNNSLASELYSWNGGSAYAIPPKPPGRIFCSVEDDICEPLFAQSYINAYNTAFNQSTSGFSENYQRALYKYQDFNPDNINNNSFIPGTFGSREYTQGVEAIGLNIVQSNINIFIHHLQDDLSVYTGTPYLFVSAGSGAGPGFMYLDWIIVTYGVPYVVSVS